MKFTSFIRGENLSLSIQMLWIFWPCHDSFPQDDVDTKFVQGIHCCLSASWPRAAPLDVPAMWTSMGYIGMSCGLECSNVTSLSG